MHSTTCGLAAGAQDSRLVDWLMEKGGPVIRYRTAAELVNDGSKVDVARLDRELLASPLVRKWLDNLCPGRIHNSKDTDFENAMGKLLEFGLRSGMAPFDRKTLHFRRALSDFVNAPRGMMRVLNASIVAAGLARAGYDDEPLCTFLHNRLDKVYEATRRAGYHIYVDLETCSGIPRLWKDKKVPVVKPACCPEGEFQLPYIHDIYGLSAFPTGPGGATVNRKINSIIRYVMAPEYQSLAPGYGLLQAGPRKYYAIGWKVDLPGYHGFGQDTRGLESLVARVELMAHFAAARSHAWFRNAVRHLEGFRTEEGTYRFPRQYLQESRDTYWVTGGHMGLEENRRHPRALEVESTFRMLRIRRLAAKNVCRAT